ncbi:MAG: hypothetical protein EXR36_06135 [Betaproteobacteria bacterium]|nr:hypothetical protein [Betaproteobacteria bacterium]
MTIRECENLCSKAGIRFTFTIHPEGFIQEMSARLAGGLFGSPPPAFDVAIANPPYRKINADSAERRALRLAGVETSNLYTGFIALIQRLLVPGGQLVGITPRSFCNGPYFRPFREDLLSQFELRRLHVFESRQAAFRDDSVLQENIIFHVVKGRNQPRDVLISTSSGVQGESISEAAFPFTEIVRPNDAEKFMHIPPRQATPGLKKRWTASVAVRPRWGSPFQQVALWISGSRTRFARNLKAEPCRWSIRATLTEEPSIGQSPKAASLTPFSTMTRRAHGSCLPGCICLRNASRPKKRAGVLWRVCSIPTW